MAPYDRGRMASPEERDRLTAEIASIKGWLTPEEAEALFDRAKACTGRGVIAEIGSYRGRSTICLGLGSQAGCQVPIFAIDLHQDNRFRRFARNIDRAGVGELITPMTGRSQEIAADFNEPVELLFIDGAHDYEGVREDFERWVPKLVEGGWLAMHDTTWTEGPKRVADTLVLRSRHFRRAQFVPGSMLLAQKVSANTPRDRLRSTAVLVVKTAFAHGSAILKQRREWLPARIESGVRRFLARLSRRPI
jgi:MMP 1-O-methyltransferase